MSYILKSVTPRSLILIDELGKSTSDTGNLQVLVCNIDV